MPISLFNTDSTWLISLRLSWKEEQGKFVTCPALGQPKSLEYLGVCTRRCRAINKQIVNELSARFVVNKHPKISGHYCETERRVSQVSSPVRSDQYSAVAQLHSRLCLLLSSIVAPNANDFQRRCLVKFDRLSKGIIGLHMPVLYPRCEWP